MKLVKLGTLFSIFAYSGIIACFVTHAWGSGPTLLEVNPRADLFLYRLILPNKPQDIFLLGTQHDIHLEQFPKIIQFISNRCDVFVEEILPVDASQRPVGELSSLSKNELENLGLF